MSHYGTATVPDACQFEFWPLLLRAARKNTWFPAKLGEKLMARIRRSRPIPPRFSVNFQANRDHHDFTALAPGSGAAVGENLDGTRWNIRTRETIRLHW